MYLDLHVFGLYQYHISRINHGMKLVRLTMARFIEDHH